MPSKNRKLNKEELELWKLVTKNDKVLGQYTMDIEVQDLHEKKNAVSLVTKKAHFCGLFC